MQFFKTFDRQTQWRSKAHRAWFYLCAVCLAFYAAYVSYLSQSDFLKSVSQTLTALCWFFLLAAALFVGMLAFCRFRRPGPCRENEKKSTLPLFLGSAALSMLILGATFLRCYPGGVSYDVANQWGQVQSGQFNNWHPVFHTLLIWLVTRVWNHFGFAVFCQQLAFSLALGYAVCVLSRSGAPRWLCLLCSALAALMEPVRNTMMFLWKDNAMTIGCTILFAHCLRLLQSGGAWLKKPRNAIAFGLALAFVTLTRQNGFLFSLPLLLLALGCYLRREKKGLLQSVLVFLLALAIVQGGVYGALDVVYPQNTLDEAVGLPMTLLLNARQSRPDVLSDEAAAFLEETVPQETLGAFYVRSNYNSVKFLFFREYVKERSAGELLSWTWETVCKAPRLAFETFNEVAGLVWDVTGEERAYCEVFNSGELDAALMTPRSIRGLGEKLTNLLSAPLSFLPLRWFSRNYGVQLLCLLLVSLWALYHGGVERLLPILPTLIYCLATMLLLCGEDARFFSFLSALAPMALVAQGTTLQKKG